MQTAWTYELLVKQIYERLLHLEENVVVHHRRRYRGKRSGQDYEVDLSFEFTRAAVAFLVLVECKFYAKKVEVGDAIEFAFKVQDIGAQKGILVSTVGFQRGVFNIARSSAMALVKVNEPDTFDVVISARGPKVDFDWAFEEYLETDLKGGNVPLLCIVDSSGQPPVFFDNIEVASRGDVSQTPWASFLVANLCCADDLDKRSESLIKEARRARSDRRFDEAVRLAEAALSIREKLHGTDHLGVADILNLLSGLYQKADRYKDGESAARRAISIRSGQLGEKHPGVAISQNNLATNLIYEERYDDAERSLQIAHQITEGTPDVVLLAAIECNLAKVYGKTNRIQEAESLYAHSLRQMEEAKGQSHPTVADVLESYLCFLRDMNRNAEAHKIEDRIKQIRSEKSCE